MDTCGASGQQLDWIVAIGISAEGTQVAAAERGTITLLELQQAPDAVR
jgi:hypothetical protein